VAASIRAETAARQAHFNAVIDADGEVALTVMLNGKPHSLRINKGERVLDVALNDGLDLPWSCCDGVCCTCRVKAMGALCANGQELHA
jgi:ring-1,2-phenylacetyl-CoA epoxidase subunit PaaE